MDRDPLVQARTIVADAEEDELTALLFSGMVYERSHLGEIARSGAGSLPWAVAMIGAFAYDDLLVRQTELPSPVQVYGATCVAIRLLRA